jgi:hypothetical protein
MFQLTYISFFKKSFKREEMGKGYEEAIQELEKLLR